MKVGGANTTGITTGSSLVLINGIFQKPTTENNLSNNYVLLELEQQHKILSLQVYHHLH